MQDSVYWLACRMDGGKNGLPAAVLTATIAFMSQPRFLPKYSGSHKPVTLISVLANRYQVFECFLCTLCYLFVLKSSQFRSSSAPPLPFPLLSNCYSGWRIISTYFLAQHNNQSTVIPVSHLLFVFHWPFFVLFCFCFAPLCSLSVVPVSSEKVSHFNSFIFMFSFVTCLFLSYLNNPSISSSPKLGDNTRRIFVLHYSWVYRHDTLGKFIYRPN